MNVNNRENELRLILFLQLLQRAFFVFFSVLRLGRDERSWITFNQIYILNLIAKFDVKLLVSKQFNSMENQLKNS